MGKVKVERRSSDTSQDCQIRQNDLEKSMIVLNGQMSTLVDSSAKMENSVSTLSNSMEILAKNQVILETHGEKIDTLFVKVDGLEERERVVEHALNLKYDTHKDTVGGKFDDVSDALKETEKELDGRGIKRFTLMLLLLAFVFGYFYLDLSSTRKDAKATDTLIIEKLDNIIVKTSEIDKTVLRNQLSSQHNRELIQSHHIEVKDAQPILRNP